MPFELRPLYGDLPPEYQRMTSAAIRPQLRALSPSSRLLAIGAVEGGNAIGLGVAKAGEGEFTAEILSLYVTPARWRHGVGSRLLEALEEALRARGCGDVALRYTTQSPTTPALEHILAKRHWSPPETQLILAQMRKGMVDESKWAQHREMAPPFEIFPWAELTPPERQSMEAFRAEVPKALWPFDDALPPDPASSLGLRHEKEIAGWMVTHRMAPKLVRFTMLFVRERWRTPALTFTLQAEASRRMRAAYGADMLSSLAVQADNLPMLRILERKFAPWITSRTEMRASAKSLK